MVLDICSLKERKTKCKLQNGICPIHEVLGCDTVSKASLDGGSEATGTIDIDIRDP